MTSRAMLPSSGSIRAVAAGSFAALALAGCSLLVDTDNLTGNGCAGDACRDASVADAPFDAGAEAAVVDACTANVQTDKANCGACGHACTTGQSCSAGACIAGCAGKTVYVSATGGKDTNDGCSESAPFATITAAVAAVQMASAVGNTIEVCAGDYVESGIVVEYPVSLLGGFDCATWMRRPTYGYPSFDPTNETVIDTSTNAASGTTLTLSGPAITSAVKVDGFTIHSPSSTINNSQSAGLAVTQSAAATVTNNKVSGASGTTSPDAALLVQFNANPEVANNAFAGGSSSSTTVGAQIASASSPSLHDNQISGGTSTGAQAIGLLVLKGLSLTGPRAVRGNTIDGGSGVGGKTPGAVAVEVSATSVDLVGNVILGGTASCPSGACVSYGVYMDSQGFGATLAGNRIVGGAVSGGSSQLVAGVQLQDTTGAWVVNNAIQGSVAGTPMENSVGIGLSFVDGNTVTVQENTVYGSSIAFSVQNANGVSVQNNLFLGQTADTTAGMSLNDCGAAGTSTFTSFADNAFVDFGASLVTRFDPTACAGKNLATIAAVEASFVGGVASGNKRLAGSTAECGADASSTCVVVADCNETQATASACIDHVLGAWDDATGGAADLRDLTRSWALATGAPCLVTQGGGNPLADPSSADAGVYDDSVDITGATRSSPVSIGAYESDVSCTN